MGRVPVFVEPIMAEPTAQEVLLIAAINRARLDPTGEAARYGIDLNEGLVAGTITFGSKQPLAFSNALFMAADAHSQAMIDAGYFGHIDPNTGSTPQSRASEAGYVGSVGENIALQGSTGTIDATDTALQAHVDLFVDSGVGGRGHRLAILDGDYQSIGVGQVLGLFTSGDTTYNASFVTEDFGIPSASGQFLTGISYTDTDANGLYSVGEARGGVTVQFGAGSTVSGAAGAFSAAIGAGGSRVTFSGGGLATAVALDATITAGTNALIDLIGDHAVETSVSVNAVSGLTKIVGLGTIGLTLRSADVNSTIFGSQGDDTIAGGHGVDQLFGGAGNDTILYDALDDLANVKGGTGFDRLVVYDLAAPTAFNLTAHEFEAATVEIHDLANNQLWAQYSDFYTANWVRTDQTVLYDTGSRDLTHFDWTNANSWANYTDSYNAAGQNTGKVVAYDDGSSFIQTFDVANTQSYSQYTDYFDAAHRNTTKIVIYDSGASYIQNFDATNTQSYSQYTDYFDAAQRNTTKAVTCDNGTSYLQSFDVANTQNYAQYTDYFDAAHRNTTKVVAYDDGSSLIQTFDVSNTQIYANYADSFDSAGRNNHKTTVMDDGTRFEQTFDVTSAYSWSSYTDEFDAAGTHTHKILTNDDGSTLVLF